MYLLDTDITSNLLDPRRSSIALKDRIRSKSMDEICIAIVTVEEMLHGAFDEVRRAQSRRRDLIEGSALFQRLHYDLHRFATMPYTAEAERIFNTFTSSVRRLGGHDCRIAAIANANGCEHPALQQYTQSNDRRLDEQITFQRYVNSLPSRSHCNVLPR